MAAANLSAAEAHGLRRSGTPYGAPGSAEVRTQGAAKGPVSNPRLASAPRFRCCRPCCAPATSAFPRFPCCRVPSPASSFSSSFETPFSGCTSLSAHACSLLLASASLPSCSQASSTDSGLALPAAPSSGAVSSLAAAVSPSDSASLSLAARSLRASARLARTASTRAAAAQALRRSATRRAASRAHRSRRAREPWASRAACARSDSAACPACRCRLAWPCSSCSRASSARQILRRTSVASSKDRPLGNPASEPPPIGPPACGEATGARPRAPPCETGGAG
mmetsp:Transcript_27725/g.61878  ORF Transcript_27725/g.61878 Transcript_27725/m.61878 type:complete len:281 (-) Transcript_27725:416-1258(-)